MDELVSFLVCWERPFLRESVHHTTNTLSCTFRAKEVAAVSSFTHTNTDRVCGEGERSEHVRVISREYRNTSAYVSR